MMLERAFPGLAAVLAAAFLSAAAPAPPPTNAITMKKDGGVYVVPVSVNGIVTVDFIVDSGASDVNIPGAVYRKLVRAGAIQPGDFVGTRLYRLADGSAERGRAFRIRSLKVGNVVVRDVVASVGGDDSNALLGQSFLERFRSWSLDNDRHALVLTGVPSSGPPRPAAAARAAPHPNDGPPLVANGRGPRAAPDDDGATVAQSAGDSGGASHRQPAAAPHHLDNPDDADLAGQYDSRQRRR